MRKFTKSIIAFAIAMVLTWGAPNVTAFAADNSSSASAQAISLNTVVTDSLKSDDYIRWYKFEIKEAGYFEVKFRASADDVGSGWDLTVYDSSLNNEIQNTTEILSSYTGAKRAFEQGTYYVKVGPNWSAHVPECNYNLEIAFTSACNWESDFNEGSNAADTITENEMVKGLLYSRDDVDWYKITIKTKGYFNVVLDLDETTNVDELKDGWNLKVLDSSFNEIQSVTGIKGSYTCANRAYAPGTYYVKIEANWGPQAPTDCVYNLTVRTTASSLWESEDNDSSGKADAITLSKTYHGLLHKSDDVDWYKVKVSGSGKLTITLNKPESTSIDDVKDGWNLGLYKSTSGETLAATKNITNSGKVTISNVKKGTYYVKISANWSPQAPTDCEYTLKATFTEGLSKVSLKSATAGKKQVKLSWKKVSGATGYYVYRSTSKSGTYTKIATIKKNSTVTYTNKKLKAKKTYYYKVVAYKTAGGKTTKGTFSAVKSAKTK